MAYIAPLVTASGTTFTQFQAGGASGQLERLISAQAATSNPLTAITATATGGGQTIAVPTVQATASPTGGGQTIAVPTSQATVVVGAVATGSLPAGTYYVGYTWATASGGETTMGAGSPAASVSNQFTVSAGNTPTVTIPALPAGASSANIYLSSTGGSNSLLKLYATGVTGTTFVLNSSLWNNSTFANGKTPPASNTTTGTLPAGTYYVGYTFTHAHGETTMGAGSPAASVSAQLTVASGNVPSVTLPSLPVGATAMNVYLSNTNGSNAVLGLFATGVTGAHVISTPRPGTARRSRTRRRRRPLTERVGRSQQALTTSVSPRRTASAKRPRAH